METGDGSATELAARIEKVEAEGWAERHLAVSDAFQRRFGTDVRRYGGAVALRTRHADFPAINRVLALGIEQPLTIEALDRIISDYRDAGIPRFLIHWTPAGRPSEATDWFAARGFRELRRMAKLYRRTELNVSVATDLSVREIGPSDAETYERIVAPGNAVPPELAPHVRSTLGHPAWRHYLAFDGGRAIAGASLFLSDGIAWCAGSATQETDRGRGAQSLLLARRLHDAAIMRCSWMVAETLEETATEGNPSLRNMRRLGFDVAYLRDSYLLTFDVRA
jgi:hypothetical protein